MELGVEWMDVVDIIAEKLRVLHGPVNLFYIATGQPYFISAGAFITLHTWTEML
jgi:hypothetical protein